MDEETESDTKKKEKRINLSIAQVAGSALAAAVAAYLAGRLGVYGTIIGAGVVSVVATTGGSIFQHLFRRTGEQLKEATVTTRPKPRRFSSARTRSTTPDARQATSTMVLPTFDKEGAEDKVTSVAARTTGPGTARTQLIPRVEQARRRDPAGAHPAPQDDDATRLLRPVDPDATRALRAVEGTGPGRPADRTQLVPRLDERNMAPGQAAARPAGVPAARHPGGPPEELSTATYGTRLRGWKRPAIGALAVFALAMGVVTGTELITGQTPSGAQGTTLSNLTHTGGSGRQQPRTPQSPGTGRSPDDGRRHGNGDRPSPDPGTSGDTGTGKGTDRGTPSPDPDPSDGGKTSPDPDSPSSPNPSPSGSADDDGTGSGDGSTDGGSQGDRPDGQQSGAPDPDPGASS
ncbi:hypothetical protein [Streptomyces decoyicus]|uniref:hypothetical protein n=1 Tax=Streptomyces decoyicus TaxID=249567 RepID=UPI00069EF553|nr:hypothetical protein [Streptomyces decoyicus]KOG39675.1 hypothetical protein ADK74_27805 [Streptomyces decoyicus]QZY18560.1 hypothetical protein K7C20_27635 [Streptomyces decoyicus]